MNREDILRKIKQGADRDKRNRRDPRYLETMGFLVAKGFLKTNQLIPLLPNKRIRITDAVWAGKNVEPRILEVLPAAILRLPRHFDLTIEKHPELFAMVKQLEKQKDTGTPLWGIPYEKLNIWAKLPLGDRRTKPAHEKKITKTYRLKPDVVNRLRQLSETLGCSETEALERTILR